MSTTPTLNLELVLEQKAKHRAALSDLDAAERILREAAKTLAQMPALAAPTSHIGNGAAIVTAPKQRSKKCTMLHAISESPNGLATQGVIAAGAAAGLENLQTKNVSPHLSSYKAKKLLDKHDGLWRINPKGREYLAKAI